MILKGPPALLSALPLPADTLVGIVVVLVFLLLFRTPLTRMVKRMFGFKSEKPVSDDLFDPAKAAAELALAQADKFPGEAAAGSGSVSDPLTQSVRAAAPAKSAKRFARSEVLWVDEHPNRNLHERLALESLGIRFTLARNPAMVLRMPAQTRQQYTAVISSSDNTPGDIPVSGLQVHEILTGDSSGSGGISAGNSSVIPFIIYAPPASLEPHRKAMEERRLPSTSRPEELFRFITQAVLNPPAAEVR